MFNILVADDHKSYTELLSEVLPQRLEDITVRVASSADQVLTILQQSSIDLLLLDLFLGEEVKDISFAQKIQMQFPLLKIIILTSANQNALMIQKAAQIGLNGYISKGVSLDELIQALLKVKRGEYVYSDDVKNVIMSLSRNELPKLTPQELAILQYLSLGIKRGVIMKNLKIRAENTYDSHIQHMKEKFNSPSVNAMLVRAAKLGYI